MVLFHPVELVSKVLKNADYADSYLWEKVLTKINLKEGDLDGKSMDNVAVPLATFKEHVLREYVEHIVGRKDILLFCQIQDYKKVIDPRLKACWLAQVKKVAGYRALCRWVGATPADKEHDFWVNLGSADVKGINNLDEDHECIIPPAFLEKRWREVDKDFEGGMTKAIKAVSECKTVAPSFLEAKEKITTGCKMRVGQRLELLDVHCSSRVRPARIKAICGRRIHIQVLKIDCDTHEDEDRQYGTNSDFWVDQASFFLFPVGWAALNNYKLAAKKEYTAHSKKIADAIISGTEPEYNYIDVTPSQLAEWKRVPHATAKWTKGMKFELLDPLGATIRDLNVATVLEVLEDGYLRIGMDGPDCEAECLPLHCTSPLLFPAGYASMYGLELHHPEEITNFRWDEYLKTTKSKAAPAGFFKETRLDRKDDFKIGARLEAADMCENLLICPATVVGTKGRLVVVNFDGWEESYNQYFDIDSKDIFPIGWCEIHGYKLERPYGDVVQEPSKKKSKR